MEHNPATSYQVEMAVESFKKALEIDPETLKEIKEKDLPWALELLEKKNKLLGLHSESHGPNFLTLSPRSCTLEYCLH